MKALHVILGTVFLGLFLMACSNSHTHGKTLKVAATAIPHAEILEFIKPDLEKEGVDLDIITVEDYNTPNRALSLGEIDANFFQHAPFLEAQKADFDYKLEKVAEIHFEPMGLYSKKYKSIKDLPNNAVVSIPSDPSNEARALILLEKAGLLTLNQQDAKTSLLNITDNPKQLKILEIDSPLLARTLDDVALSAITANFALQAGLSPKDDALATEKGNSLFANILVVREGDVNREDIQKLKEALTSAKVQAFIRKHYGGSVIPVDQPS